MHRRATLGRHFILGQACPTGACRSTQTLGPPNANHLVRFVLLGSPASHPVIVEHQLKSRTAAYWFAALILCFVGALVLANDTEGNTTLATVMPLLFLASMLALLRFCWFFLKARERSPAWMLLLVFNLFGLLVLLCLTDRSTHVSRP